MSKVLDASVADTKKTTFDESEDAVDEEAGLLGASCRNGKVEQSSEQHGNVDQGSQATQPESEPSIWGLPLKYVCLVILILWTSFASIFIRTIQRTRPNFSESSIIAASEAMKTVTAFLLVVRDEKGFYQACLAVKTQLTTNPLDNCRICLPSLLYVIQNNLMLISLQYLDTSVQQVLYQFKIFTTAIFAVTMLGKRLSSAQWAALVLLFVGLVLIMWPRKEVEHKSSNANTSGIPHETMLGFAAVVAACFTSGFAAVYLERILKDSQASVWLRNVQMGVAGMCMALVVSAMRDGEQLAQLSLFHDWDRRAVGLTFVMANGGLLFAVVLKYADNILRCFAVALSIVLTSILSAALGNYEPDMLFLSGMSGAIGATFLYSLGWPTAFVACMEQGLDDKPSNSDCGRVIGAREK